MDPRRDIPRATMWGLWTLVFFGVGTLILNTGTSSEPPGSAHGRAAVPGVHRHLRGWDGGLLALIAVAGLVASFHTIIFAYGRNIFSLSRAGTSRSGCRSHTGSARLPSSRSCWAGSWATASRGGSTSRRDERRRIAVDDGGLRRRYLVLHADALFHLASTEAPGHRTAVSEPLGPRRGDRGHHRPRVAGLPIPGRQLPPGCDRDGDLVRPRLIYFAVSGRNRSCSHRRRSSRSRRVSKGSHRKRGIRRLRRSKRRSSAAAARSRDRTRHRLLIEHRVRARESGGPVSRPAARV